jgi:hypothetical protein
MLRFLALGIGLFVAAALLSERLELARDDPLVLRWLRVVVEHPVRGSLGFALCLGAVLPRRAGSLGSANPRTKN